MRMPSGPTEPSTCGTWICDGSSHGYADKQSVEFSPGTTRQKWVVTVAKYPSFWSYFEENRELSSPFLVIEKNALSGLQPEKESLNRTCGTSTMLPVNFSPLALVKTHGLWKRSSLVFVGNKCKCYYKAWSWWLEFWSFQTFIWYSLGVA